MRTPKKRIPKNRTTKKRIPKSELPKNELKSDKKDDDLLMREYAKLARKWEEKTKERRKEWDEFKEKMVGPREKKKK